LDRETIKMTSIYQDNLQSRCPDLFNLAEYVLENANKNPTKKALEIISKFSNYSISFEELKSRVLKTGNALIKLGLNRNDKILLRLDNTVTFPIAYLGAISVGIIPVPTSINLTEYELMELVKILQPEAIITSKPLSINLGNMKIISETEIKKLSFEGDEANFERGDPDRLAYIVFTSGTSNKPRAVLHAHRAIWARQSMHSDWYALNSNDRLLHAGAFNWTYTLGTGLLDPWSVGATAIVLDYESSLSDLPHIIKNSGATLFAAVPGVYRRLLDQNEKLNFPKLRHCLSAGEKLTPNIHKKWRNKTKKYIYEAFGMSECSTFVSTNKNTGPKIQTIGRPQRGRKVAIIDQNTSEPVPIGEVGIIAVSTQDQGLMIGYHNEQDIKSNNKEWFATGDLGKMNPEGFIEYLGRADDILNQGGFRVSPKEIEYAFLDLEGLDSIVAFNLEIKKDTTVIAAIFTTQVNLNVEDLQNHAKKRLAKYKNPRVYIKSEIIPTVNNGKISRKNLSKTFKGLNIDST